jgi:hypothetical protein
VTAAAVHMYDTNHLIPGVKAEGEEIEPNLIKAAQPICTATLTLYGWLCDWDTATIPNGSHSMVSEATGPDWECLQRRRRLHREELMVDAGATRRAAYDASPLNSVDTAPTVRSKVR